MAKALLGNATDKEDDAGDVYRMERRDPNSCFPAFQVSEAIKCLSKMGRTKDASLRWVIPVKTTLQDDDKNEFSYRSTQMVLIRGLVPCDALRMNTLLWDVWIYVIYDGFIVTKYFCWAE